MVFRMKAVAITIDVAVVFAERGGVVFAHCEYLRNFGGQSKLGTPSRTREYSPTLGDIASPLAVQLFISLRIRFEVI